MCGFAGFVRESRGPGERERRRALLERMQLQLLHRGPDEGRFYDDGVLALVFRRLAIVGVDNGSQPLWNESGTALTVVNGEIYNHLELRRRLAARHVFATASDAEAVVHLHEELGAQAIAQLVGKFALAVWEPRERRLLLARDRLGVKPLYWAETPGGFLFGSELKALLVHPDCPRELDWAHVLDPEWTVPTFVRGVNHLPGGHSLTLVPGAPARVTRYWDLGEHLARPDAEPRPRAACVDELERLFAASVRDRLMSDVPLGVFLSGGLDSSAVVAAAVAAGGRPACFTVVERNSVLCGDASAAEELARHFDLPFHGVLFDLEHLPDQLDFSLDTLEYFVWMMDSPRFRQEWFLKHELHRYARGAVPDLKVVLLGQGADEFAGGYSKQLFPSRGHRGWDDYVASLHRQHTRIRLAELGVPQVYWPALSPRVREELGGPAHEAYAREVLFRVDYLQRHNLWHEDRTAASQGVEARVPYLDHRLVEYLVGIPRAQHAELFWNKSLLRDVARRFLPAAAAARPKVGFLWTRENASAGRLDLELLRRCFPAFRERYLDAPEPVFERQAFEAEQARVLATGQGGELLLQLMAVAVFERHCRCGTRFPEGALRPPSPLRRLDAVAEAPWRVAPV